MLQGMQRLWVAVAVLVGLVLVVVFHGDYGVTWDEGVQARYGELTLDYYRSGGEDVRYRDYGDLRFYGPLVETGLALAYAGRPEQRFEVRHLLLGLLALGLVPALAVYTRGLGPAAIGPVSVLALVLLPRLLGHATNNSKDVPFALGVSLFMAGLVVLFGEGRRDLRAVCCAGAGAGLALAVRPGGLPLLGVFFGAAALLGHWAGTAPFDAARWRRDALAAGGYWALALGIMIVSWPWALEAPLAHPVQVIARAAEFDRTVPVLYDGLALSSDTLPRSYLPWLLLITTPLSVIFLAGYGVGAEAPSALRRGAGRAGFTFALTLVWLGVPLVVTVLVHPNLYDGIRHFLFVLPALAVLAALGACRLAEALARRVGRPWAWAVAVGILLVPLISLVRLHPYQTTYYNPLVGGLGGAAGRYDTDYWGTSLREATLWIRTREAERAELRHRPSTILLGSTSPYPRTAVVHAAGEGFQVVTLGDLAAHPDRSLDVDYYVALDRFGMASRFPSAAVVYRVERDGATLALVRDMGGQPVRATPGAPPGD